MFELNPLNVLKIREVRFVPKHFSQIDCAFTFDYDVKQWIVANLKGRFAILKKQQAILTIAFEEPKELTFFSLACPHIRRN